MLAAFDQLLGKVRCCEGFADALSGRREFEAQSVELRSFPNLKVMLDSIASIGISREVFPVQSLVLITDIRHVVVLAQLHLCLTVAGVLLLVEAIGAVDPAMVVLIDLNLLGPAGGALIERNALVLSYLRR